MVEEEEDQEEQIINLYVKFVVSLHTLQPIAFTAMIRTTMVHHLVPAKTTTTLKGMLLILPLQTLSKTKLGTWTVVLHIMSPTVQPMLVMLQMVMVRLLLEMEIKLTFVVLVIM